VKLQIMPEREAETYAINPFDLTKVWPHKDYPLIDIGTLELNRNVDNYFAETEQSAFSPSNLVPGTGASPDKVLQARIFAYPDAQRYRVGANYNDLPVNCPHATRAQNYQRGGNMAGAACPYSGEQLTMSGRAGINYGPNSKGGPSESRLAQDPPLNIDGDASRYDHGAGNDDYEQAGDLYRLMAAEERQRLVDNIAGGLSQCSVEVQDRMFPHFDQCDPEYGHGVREVVGRIIKSSD